MSRKSDPCLRCGGSMETGFMVGMVEYGTPSLLNWYPGVTVRTIFNSLKLDKKAKREVTALRCTRCSRLDYYVD